MYHATLDQIDAKHKVAVGTAHFPRPETTHAGNREVPPDEWGMTMRQFMQFLNSCKATPEWQDIRRKIGFEGKCGHVSGYDLCEHFVKPYTRGTGNGVALTLNPDVPKRAQIM